MAALELRGKIPVDFQADADLNERRGGPGHFLLLGRSGRQLSIFPAWGNPSRREDLYFELGDLAAGPFLLPGIP
jgi:hypothetical protein